MNPHCRVRRVRLKNGGMVEVLPTVKDQRKSELLRHARMTTNGFKDGNIAGHFVIAWDKSGAYSVGFFNDDCVIGKTLLPSWLADVVRRELIAVGAWSMDQGG